MIKVVILGSTGSLGVQTLEVISKYKNLFQVVGLSSHTKENLLKEQAKKFNVPAENTLLASKFPDKEGSKRLCKLAREDADIIINVLSGTSGIVPTLAAIKAGKTILLGNKESLVAEGGKIKSLSKKNKTEIIPLDSEHNAIFEILKKHPNKIKNIFIPCSGGPFWNKTAKELKNLSVEKALKHPRWRMGTKISIESASLINKGFEIIEAHYLFNMPLSKIHPFFHPECKIHGIVEFENNKSYAYISKPDMKIHIENALLRTAKTANKKPKFKITKFDINKIKSRVIKNPPLPGIKIVLNEFKKHPREMKKFLQKEEHLIKKLLTKEINFAEFLRRVGNYQRPRQFPLE